MGRAGAGRGLFSVPSRMRIKGYPPRTCSPNPWTLSPRIPIKLGGKRIKTFVDVGEPQTSCRERESLTAPRMRRAELTPDFSWIREQF
jgi:hypothetical protein